MSLPRSGAENSLEHDVMSLPRGGAGNSPEDDVMSLPRSGEENCPEDGTAGAAAYTVKRRSGGDLSPLSPELVAAADALRKRASSMSSNRKQVRPRRSIEKSPGVVRGSQRLLKTAGNVNGKFVVLLVFMLPCSLFLYA